MGKLKPFLVTFGLLAPALIAAPGNAVAADDCVSTCLNSCLAGPTHGIGDACVPKCNLECEASPARNLFEWSPTQIYHPGDQFFYQGSRWEANTFPYIANTPPGFCPECHWYGKQGIFQPPDPPPYGQCFGGPEPQYAAGKPYNLGDIADRIDNRFRCIVPGWCSSAGAWAYAPGTGEYWNMAWELMPQELAADNSACLDDCRTVCGTADPGDPLCSKSGNGSCIARCANCTGDQIAPCPPPKPPTPPPPNTPAKPALNRVAYIPSYSSFGRHYRIKNIKTSGLVLTPTKDKTEGLTHLIYAFATVDISATRSPTCRIIDDSGKDWLEAHTAENSIDGVADPNELLPAPDGRPVHLRGAFNQLRKLKKMAQAKGQYLKVLLSLGGFSLSDDFEAATDTDEKRKNLAKNCVDMLIRGTAPILDHDPTKPGDQRKFMTDTARQELTEVFDGIDIDWEFPTQRHCSDTLGQADPNCGGTLNVDLLVAGDCVDKPNFTKLLEEFRAQLGPNRLLAVAIGNTPIHLNFYDLAGMAKPGLLDFIDLFGYDNFGGFSEKTAHQGALLAGRGAPGRPETDFFLNIQDSVVRLMELGVPPGLINVGIPLYGRGVQWTAGHMLPPSFDSDGLDAPLEHPLLLKPGVAGTDFELYRAARGMFDQSDRATGHISSKGKVVHKGEVLTYHFDYGFWPNSGVEDYNDLVKERDRMNADHLDKSGPGAAVQKLKHFYDPAVGAAWLFGLYNTRNEVNQLLDGDPANDDHLQITGPSAGPARWQFWSVEDLDTVKQKVDWVKKNNLGGAFVFELSQDYRTRVDLTAGATGDPRDGELTKQMVKGLQ